MNLLIKLKDKGKQMHPKQGSAYLWSYVAKAIRGRVLRSRIKYAATARRGSHAVDWVGGRAWNSPIVALAPPKGALPCQNSQ